MARKARIHYPGAFYHVMCRGNQGQRIFKDDRDRKYYISLLKESPKRFGYKLYAHVLMSNHVHLLVGIGRIPLSKVMQNILFRYTRYWNKRYRKVGHLFQGRYKAILCDKEAYLLELVRYVHLNPVRAKLVKYPERYPWSSHRAYLNGEGEGWIDVEGLLPQWGGNKKASIERYRGFVREGIKQGHREDFYQVVDQRYLGDEGFIAKVEEQVTEDEPQLKVEIRWDEIKKKVLKEYGVPEAAIMHGGRGRKEVRIRRIIAWLGREVGGFTIKQMAIQLGQDATVLGRGLVKVMEELGKDKVFQMQIKEFSVALRKGRLPKRDIKHA